MREIVLSQKQNSFDMVYCEWEKFNHNLKEIIPKEDKSDYKKRKHA